MKHKTPYLEIIGTLAIVPLLVVVALVEPFLVKMKQRLKSTSIPFPNWPGWAGR